MRTTDDDQDGVERIARNYTGVADGYAELWSPLLRPVGRRLLQVCPWAGARRIVDVGTGTGALLPDLRELAPKARIVGVDRSFGMIALAARSHASLAMMDAMQMGLRTGAFDAAVMAFVLFHMPDPVAALSEVRRLLRHRGVLGLVTWAEESTVPASHVWDEELAACGAWDPSPMPMRRHELMNTPGKVSALLAAAAFVPARVWIERIEHLWDVGRFIALGTRFGATKRKLETLDATTRAALLARVRERMARLASADFLYRGAAICAVAVR